MRRRFLAICSTLLLTVGAAPISAQGTDYQDQIRALMNEPAVHAALEHIEATDEQTMEDLRTLTQIPAPPFMEEERGLAFLEMLREVGVDIAVFFKFS